MRLISYIADPQQGIAAIAYEDSKDIATLTADGPNLLEDKRTLQRLTYFCRGRGEKVVTNGTVTDPVLSALREGGVRSIVQVQLLLAQKLRRQVTAHQYADIFDLPRPIEVNLYSSDCLLYEAAVVARAYIHVIGG